ncbi:MAG: site-specific DNA-methyltransferase [Acidobacteria bacterium]|nr:site-specific DNA-methyltransferase [Acidobacteriota bacterium]MBA3884302.1 site-specific DNA-methyltransferase [Acidobacteriota bacterium]
MPGHPTPLSPIKPHTVLESARGRLQFFLGDCLDVLPALAPGSISAIATSPPYNLGIRYRTYHDALPRERYLEWTARWVAEARRTLAADGSLFLNVGSKPTDPWAAFDVAQAVRGHLHLQNTIHWVKSIAIERELAGTGAALDRDIAVGHYKPINSDRFVNDCHEFIFHFTPDGRTPLDRRAIGVPYQDASNIARWRTGGSNRRCRGNTWFIPYETIQSREDDRPHPATFPSRVPEYCFRLHGAERISVALDPFLGLGSSAVAAAQLGLDFIGIEMDEHYLHEAVRRVEASLKG